MYLPDTQIGKVVESRYTPRLQGSTDVDEAMEVMDEYEVDVIGVECESDFVGLFSRADFEKKVIRWNLHPSSTTLYEVITLSPPYVTPKLSIRETYNAMLAYQSHHMPVISGKKLLGIAHMGQLRKYIDDAHENFTEDQRLANKHMPQADKIFLPEHVAAGNVRL